MDKQIGLVSDMEKRSISGLKLSGEMLALTVHPSQAGRDLFSMLCRLLAHARINIAYSTIATMDSLSGCLCCIDIRDQDAMETAVGQDGGLRESLRYVASVGLIQFFPHYSSLRMLGQALDILSADSIRVYGFSSSISSICFVIDFARLTQAADGLSRWFQLPANHAPLISQRTVRQIMPGCAQAGCPGFDR